MLALLSALLLASSLNNPLPECRFDDPVIFSDSLEDLPEPVEADFLARVGPVHPASEEKFIFVARSGDRWIVYYLFGGITAGTRMVGYTHFEGTDRISLHGALQGEPCAMARAFLAGVNVVPWFDMKPK